MGRGEGLPIKAALTYLEEEEPGYWVGDSERDSSIRGELEPQGARLTLEAEWTASPQGPPRRGLHLGHSRRSHHRGWREWRWKMAALTHNLTQNQHKDDNSLCFLQDGTQRIRDKEEKEEHGQTRVRVKCSVVTAPVLGCLC